MKQNVEEIAKLMEDLRHQQRETRQLIDTGVETELLQSMLENIRKTLDNSAQKAVPASRVLHDDVPRISLDLIVRWLSTTDPSSNHIAACQKRQPSTGEWLLKSPQLLSWMEKSNALLWLRGIRELYLVSLNYYSTANHSQSSWLWQDDFE